MSCAKGLTSETSGNFHQRPQLEHELAIVFPSEKSEKQIPEYFDCVRQYQVGNLNTYFFVFLPFVFVPVIFFNHLDNFVIFFAVWVSIFFSVFLNSLITAHIFFCSLFTVFLFDLSMYPQTCHDARRMSRVCFAEAQHAAFPDVIWHSKVLTRSYLQPTLDGKQQR